MVDSDLVREYNYPVFNADVVERNLRFDDSPALGSKAPDFTVHELDGDGTMALSDLWKQHAYLVIEFGSFT